MIDFNILHGLSTELFSAPGVVNPDLIIEEGCWYLCTDTAELYLGVKNTATGEFALKQINRADEAIDSTIIELLNVEINKVKESLGDYVKKTDIEDFATEEFVNKKIAEAELADKEVDLEAYYTKSEVDALIPDTTGFIKEIPSEYITEEELTAKGYLTEHQDLSNYALKSDIPTDYLKEIPAEYVTESELTAKGYITDISGKADAEHKHALSDITDYSAPDLSEYAKRSELPDVSGFIKEIPAEYITETELEAKGYITVHQDLSEYAKKSDIPTDYIKAIPDEYITETELAEELAKIPRTDLSNYYNKDEVNGLIAGIEHPANPTKVSELENDAGYATEQYVIDAIANQVPVENLAKKEEVEEVKTKLENEVLPTIQETILPVVEKAATQEWINEQGFLTEHQSLEGYARQEELFSKSYNDLTDKPEIPSIDGLATEAFVQAEIEKIDIPTVDTGNLVTIETLNNVLATKANEIPFTTSNFVTNPMGSFKAGEDIKGLTIAELFAKLLGLTADSDEPNVPDEDATPAEIIDYLIATEARPYSQDTQGNLVATDFAATTWTKSESIVEMNGVSTAYKIIDESGEVIEAGYQEATDYNEEAWLTVALPSEIKNVKVKMYRPDLNDWDEMNWKVVPATEQTIEGYTIWTVPEEYEVMSGDTYRFVVIN